VPTASCAHCGGEVEEGTRHCPHCGVRLVPDDGEDATVVLEPPPEELGPVPIAEYEIEPELFGVTPPLALATLAGAALVVAVVLLVLGYAIAGAVLVLVALVGFALFLGVAKRKPDSRFARWSVRAAERGRAELDVLAARSDARRRRARARSELARLRGGRRELLLELGTAVYEGDVSATERKRAELEELDGTLAHKEAAMATIGSELDERVRRARLDVQPTEMVEAPETPGPDVEPAPGEANPPEPARIPEPYPPPDEGDPPEPARIPEPYPPPDEGEPPEAARTPD
jgi:RNA polymerase subunit RPABC4/transcription elongation factor Spt4